jgi:hypothetical protein
MIYNKSSHPVEVKKISIRLWSKRDEIESAIGRRMKECEAAGVPLFIDDIKAFYNLDLKEPLNQQTNVLPLKAVANEPETSAQTSEAAPSTEESKTFNQAEEIIAEQSKQGLETNKPNPILQRPYQRQAPDLDKISYGFALLADINMETILSFTKDKFLQGQSVVVEFLIPQNFIMTADVTYCHHYAMRSRIISSTKPDYRLQCRYSFAIPGERENLRKFLKSIEPDLTQIGKKSGPAADDDSLGI